MPELSRFFGIIITMNYEDHSPPHFHVRYGDQKAMIEIRTMRLLEGLLSPRVFGMVMEWGLLHQAELQRSWDMAQQHCALTKISPLE